MKNYGRYTFKKYTIYQFNENFKDGKIKNNLMGFYSWLTRIAENNTIYLSKDLLAKRWNRTQSKKASRVGEAYKKVNSSTVFRWLVKLEKANLLFVERDGSNGNKYILNQDGSIHPNISTSQKKCNAKHTNKKATKTVENTDTQNSENVHKDKPVNSNNKDIDTYNSKQVTDSVDNFDYETYLEQNKKCDNWDHVLTLLNKAFKAMKVRSKEIKGNVISKVFDYHTHITKKHAMSYIIKAINNARDLYYKKHNQYKFNNSNAIDPFNAYEQRTYDYEELEKQLLGWV